MSDLCRSDRSRFLKIEGNQDVLTYQRYPDCGGPLRDDDPVTAFSVNGTAGEASCAYF